MAIPVAIPRLGWSMEQGTFVEWRKRDGDTVRPGEVLYVLEGEKAAEEIESLDAGTLRIPNGPEPGAVLPIGHVIGWLVGEGEAVPNESSELKTTSEPAALAGGGGQKNKTTTPQTHAPGTLESLGVPPAANAAGSQGSPGFAVTPRARRVASELGVDPAKFNGSGRNGRVRECDVRAATDRKGRLIPHTSLRKVIAARMVAGVTVAAPVTLHTKVDATNFVAQRKANGVGVNDLLICLTAATLRKHPLLQAQWRDEGLFLPDEVHIAVAVDSDAGLLAPVVRDADRLSLADLAVETKAMIAATRAGTLTADKLRDATFTITNLGTFGIDAFTPVITLPQSAVLGVGRIVRVPTVVGDSIVPRDQMTLSLTFDHRVVDGAPAARFLHDLRQTIEAGHS